MDLTDTSKQVRIAFETLGCRSNYADTVELQAAAVEKGAIPVSFREGEADIFVLNTCTITDAADKEVYKLLRRIRKRYPKALIVTTGCLAFLKSDELLASGLVDVSFKARESSQIIEMILDTKLSRTSPTLVRCGRKDEKKHCLSEKISDVIPGPGHLLGALPMRSRFALRVQEGCNNYCTYCIVPYARGACTSRPADEILSDISRLAKQGYGEIVLTGTNIGSYGTDINSSFCALLERISDLKPNLRIRLSSLDPNELSNGIVDLIANNSLFCPHIHLSLQSLSDNVLKRMKRRYKVEFVLSLLENIKQRVGRVGIGADLIAGFPGESREEVEQAIALFLELPISYLHVFPYSEREGTVATRLDSSVPVLERQERARRWRQVANSKRVEFFRSLEGTVLDVIIETKLAGGMLSGTSGEYAPITVSETPKNINAKTLKPGDRVSLRAVRFLANEGRLLCE